MASEEMIFFLFVFFFVVFFVLFFFFRKFSFRFQWQPIKFSDLDKIHMFSRGLPKARFCEHFVKISAERYFLRR